MADANEANREAVIAAAYRYAAKPDSPRRSRALIDAVRKLEAATCPATAIGGDPAWPHVFRCALPVHEGNHHRDKDLGEWRSRNG